MCFTTSSIYKQRAAQMRRTSNSCSRRTATRVVARVAAAKTVRWEVAAAEAMAMAAVGKQHALLARASSVAAARVRGLVGAAMAAADGATKAAGRDPMGQ